MKMRKALANLDIAVAVAALVALILLTFAGVFMRYYLGKPIIWQEEVQLGLITWVIFLGGSAAFRGSHHMAIEIVVDILPQPLRRAAERFIFLVVTATLLFFGYNAVILLIQFSERSRITSVLHIPAQYIYFIIPVGCLLMLVSHARYAWPRLTGKAEAEAEAEKNGRPRT